MSGTGLVFTGCIGVGLAVPTEVFARQANTDSIGGAGVTLAPPVGILEGDVMVACVEAGGYGFDAFGPYGFTADPAWTPVHVDASNGAFTHIIANLYTKIADADDEAGTTAYSWSVSTSALAGIAVVLAGWRPMYGRTISNPAINYTSTPSLASPGGAWQLAFITQRTRSSFAQPFPDPVITSPRSTLFGTATGAYRAGTLRVYGSNNVSPITGAYLGGPDEAPHYAMVVAAVSA